MSFLAFWIGWTLLGLVAALALFVWAARTRQFDQSRRAGLLPFDDVAPEDGGNGDRHHFPGVVSGRER